MLFIVPSESTGLGRVPYGRPETASSAAAADPSTGSASAACNKERPLLLDGLICESILDKRPFLWFPAVFGQMTQKDDNNKDKKKIASSQNPPENLFCILFPDLTSPKQMLVKINK